MDKRKVIALPLVAMSALLAKAQDSDNVVRDTMVVVREIKTENNVKDTSYMASGVKNGYFAIEKGVKDGYKKIEDGVVNGYLKIQDGVVAGWHKVEDKCVVVLFSREGETVEQTKARLNAGKERRK